MRPVDVAFSARRRQALLSVAVCLSPAAPPVLGGAWPALAAAELTDEQSLIVEAWAVVQRGYVDQQFGGRDWKATKSEYLKRKYRNAGEAREAVSEMVALLGDRYTRYLSPGAYAALLAKYERPADNGGIGVTVRNVPMSLSTPTPGAGRGPVEIVSVVDGGPADIAGLRVGDVFETIDNRPLPAYATADDAAGLLLGRLDEPLSVGVRRADGSSASFTTKRAVLKQGEVEASVAERSAGKRIGVLKIGGHFPSGVEAAKLFLPSDVTVVATVDRTGKPSPTLTFSAGQYASMGRPTYLLVDRGTASAAEVFAAALQDNRAAKVVGEQTYGKGLVQSIQKLTDSSAVVLTVAKYRTPRGTDINGKGVTPDMPIACAAGASAVECLDAAIAARR